MLKMNLAALGHLEVAQLLCEAGADKDRADQDGDRRRLNGYLHPVCFLRFVSDWTQTLDILSTDS